jgi:hypothetical protein
MLALLLLPCAPLPTSVCVQVQSALRHIASTVLQDPRLQLTHSRQHARSRASTKGPAATISLPPTNSQQQQQQVLSAASGMVPRAVRQLEASLPVGAVCVKALQGWYWGLDAFQADFSAAVDDVRCGSSTSCAAGWD